MIAERTCSVVVSCVAGFVRMRRFISCDLAWRRDNPSLTASFEPSTSLLALLPGKMTPVWYDELRSKSLDCWGKHITLYTLPKAMEMLTCKDPPTVELA